MMDAGTQTTTLKQGVGHVLKVILEKQTEDDKTFDDMLHDIMYPVKTDRENSTQLVLGSFTGSDSPPLM